MFLRWLTTVFPRDIQRGWLLITADIGFWCSVAAALALLAVTPLVDHTEQSETLAAVAALALATVLRIVIAPLVLVTAAVRFDAVQSGRGLAWAPIAKRGAGRLVPVLVAWLLAAALCRAGSLFVQAAMVAMLQTAERDVTVIRPWAELVGVVVFVGLLVRFAFVPFLAGLHSAEDVQDHLPAGGGPSALAQRLAWPLTESNRMTRDIRREILPYLVLGVYAPAAAAAVPTLLRPFLSFGLHLLSFTAWAVLFYYYVERVRPAGVEPAPASSTWS